MSCMKNDNGCWGSAFTMVALVDAEEATSGCLMAGGPPGATSVVTEVDTGAISGTRVSTGSGVSGAVAGATGTGGDNCSSCIRAEVAHVTARASNSR
uniref:Uncharacterized protein n=1 Tax=Nelumbo nucifera TaxID=4432 RepID=A0A822Y104_NELNU|nr:TPA_asm: hypothetical protein HUJ06_027420 [Nelumbo nucifera]